MSVFFDIVEFLAVFLLAVEAIKLENLKAVTKDFLKPLASRLNPEIEFVDDVSHLNFFERNSFNIWSLFLYLFGAFLICILFYIYNIDAIGLLSEADPVYWVISILGLLIVPFIVGFLPYQIIVWFLECSIKALTWVQFNTHTGVVGILGFLLFTLQYWGRRALLS